jgi:hypothetical protein
MAQRLASVLMPRIGHVVAVAAAVSLLAPAAVVSLPNVAHAADATVTVSSTPAGSVLTQLSTNNVWSGMIDQYPAAVKNFNSLALPLVRLHVGDDGYPAAMPEIKQGQWSMAALDALVNDEAAGGGGVVMNIKFAPDWMWSCYPNSIGVNGTQGTGSVKDLTFATFAGYMARLVSYYNKGSLTTESGTVITNPAGTANRVTYWELWNEPDLNNETPCAPSNGLGLTPAQYVTMWNAVTAAMLKVDPSLRFVGPATAGGQFGSSTGVGNDYVTQLESGATVKPFALSFHGYGYWDNTVPDKWIFDGDGTQGGGGIGDIVSAASLIHSSYPGTPIWLTEVNVNSAWGNDTYKRPWTAFGAAWWASVYSQLAPLGVQMIHQYDVMDSPQFGLLDDTNGGTRLPYWTEKVLNTTFPPGSTLLSSSSSLAGVQTLAAKRPDGTVNVLVVNRQLNSATTKGGPGQPATVTVNLDGLDPQRIVLQQVDATTTASAGPAIALLPARSSVQVSLPGYGFAVLSVITSSSPPPAEATTIVLSRSAAVVSYGHGVTLAVRLSASGTSLAGGIVTFYGRPHAGGSWAPVGHATTGGSGSARLTVKPRRNQDYYARFAGAAGFLTSSSHTVSAAVRPAVSSHVTVSKVRRWVTTYVTGSVAPKLRGHAVTLQRYGGGRWHPVAARRLTSTSHFRFPLRWTTRGVRYYRVFIGRVTGFVSGAGSRLRITVI